MFNKLVDHQRFRVIYDSSQSPQSQGGTTTTAVVFLQTLALTRDFNFATFRQNAFLLLLYFLQKKSKNTQKTHSIIMGICIYILVKELYYYSLTHFRTSKDLCNLLLLRKYLLVVLWHSIIWPFHYALRMTSIFCFQTFFLVQIFVGQWKSFAPFSSYCRVHHFHLLLNLLLFYVLFHFWDL